MKKILSTIVVATLVSAIPTLVKADTVYYTDGNANKLERINSDGTGLTDLLTTSSPVGISDPRALVTDGISLYWGNNSPNRVCTFTLSDSSTSGFLPFVAASGLAVSGDYLYYTTWSGGVYRVNKDGSGQANLVPGRDAGFAGIYVTADSIYYAAYNENKVYKTNLSGGDASAIYTAGAGANLTDVYVTNSNVFISDFSGINGIIKTDLNGGSATSIIGGTYYDIDIAGSTLYYTTGGNEVGYMNLDGSGWTMITGDANSAYGIAVVADTVPEPSSFVLLGIGAVGLALLRRKSACK